MKTDFLVDLLNGSCHKTVPFMSWLTQSWEEKNDIANLHLIWHLHTHVPVWNFSILELHPLLTSKVQHRFFYELENSKGFYIIPCVRF